MAFPSRKETYDFDTSSDGYRRSPKGGTIQSDRSSISNSSVLNSSVRAGTGAATSEDLSNYSERNPGSVPSNSHRKSFHSLEKSTIRFGNQSQSTVGIIREAGSVRSSTATSSSTRSSKSNIPYFEDEDESPDDILLEDRAREARVLESKVARVASRSFSVAEITALQKEVDRWLTKVTAADAVRVLSSSTSLSLTLPHPQSPALLSPALFLSSLLLKIILANHLVFSDASEVSKNTEMSLKAKVEELELEKRRLELELRELVIIYVFF